jgi:hypothetical protein
MTEAEKTRLQNEQIIGLTRRLRNDPEVWEIFKRVGFREYLTENEIVFLLNKIPHVGFNEFNPPELDIQGDDWKISIGLLERLADGMLTDADLEGEWVSAFIQDRWHTPIDQNNHSTQKPTELGWIMALAREIEADPNNWKYFINLTEFQHDSPRDRPLPNPIAFRSSQFRLKHCLGNRESTLGIWPLLYAKHEKYSKPKKKIDNITNIDQVKRALSDSHKTEPNWLGGYNLDIYFEDLNR